MPVVLIVPEGVSGEIVTRYAITQDASNGGDHETFKKSIPGTAQADRGGPGSFHLKKKIN